MTEATKTRLSIVKQYMDLRPKVCNDTATEEERAKFFHLRLIAHSHCGKISDEEIEELTTLKLYSHQPTTLNTLRLGSESSNARRT